MYLALVNTDLAMKLSQGFSLILDDYLIWKSELDIKKYLEVEKFPDALRSGFSIIGVTCNWENDTADIAISIGSDTIYNVRKIIAGRPLQCKLFQSFQWKNIVL